MPSTDQSPIHLEVGNSGVPDIMANISNNPSGVAGNISGPAVTALKEKSQA